MRVKVLMVGGDLAVGGICGYVDTLTSLCNPQRFLFHMTVSGNPASEAAPRFDGVVKHILPIKYSSVTIKQRTSQLRGLLRQESFDVLHLHAARAGLLGCLAAANLPVAVVYTGHGWRFDQKSVLQGKWVFEMLERFICRRSHLVTFIRAVDLDLGLRRHLVDSHKSVVIRSRIDAGRLQRLGSEEVVQQKQLLGIPPAATVVGVVGRMAHQKDPLTFVRVAARVSKVLPDLFFLWVGGGELLDQARALATRMGIADRIIFTGAQPAEAVPALLHTMDVFLCTSLYEAVPLGLLEAQAARRPVVCSAFAGVEELLQHGVTGLLFEIGNEAQASGCVLDLCRSPAIRTEMAERAFIQLAERHAGPEKMARDYEAVYTEARSRVQKQVGAKVKKAEVMQ